MAARGPRRGRGVRGRGLVAGLTVGVLALLVTPLVAQDPPSLLQREARFNSAVQDYEAALGAWATQQQLWEEKVMALEEVRRSGNDERFDAAFRELEEESRELQRLDLRVRTTRESAETAKLALLEGLDRRREELEARYASVSGAAEERRIEDLLMGVMAQYRRLEDEPLSPNPVQPLLSTITFDPRDRPPSLRFKIELLERRVQIADSTIGQIDRRIERLQGLQRIQQMSEDFRAGVVRFDDDRLPTGPPPASDVGEEGMPADSTAAQEAVPLPQQIAEARRLRERLVEFRDEVARRAEEFREELRRITA